MNEEYIADIWMMMKPYLDKKHTEMAAEKYVDLLADFGVDDITLKGVFGTDNELDNAISYYLELDEAEAEIEEE